MFMQIQIKNQNWITGQHVISACLLVIYFYMFNQYSLSTLNYHTPYGIRHQTMVGSQDLRKKFYLFMYPTL